MRQANYTPTLLECVEELQRSNIPDAHRLKIIAYVGYAAGAMLRAEVQARENFEIKALERRTVTRKTTTPGRSYLENL